MEEKKLLSFIESTGLLSAAEKAGVTLSKVEELRLLSTAERLGLLSLLESAATTDGAIISSLGLPFFALGCGARLSGRSSPPRLTLARRAARQPRCSSFPTRTFS